MGCRTSECACHTRTLSLSFSLSLAPQKCEAPLPPPAAKPRLQLRKDTARPVCPFERDTRACVHNAIYVMNYTAGRRSRMIDHHDVQQTVGTHSEHVTDAGCVGLNGFGWAHPFMACFLSIAMVALPPSLCSNITTCAGYPHSKYYHAAHKPLCTAFIPRLRPSK